MKNASTIRAAVSPSQSGGQCPEQSMVINFLKAVRIFFGSGPVSSDTPPCSTSVTGRSVVVRRHRGQPMNFRIFPTSHSILRRLTSRPFRMSWAFPETEVDQVTKRSFMQSYCLKRSSNETKWEPLSSAVGQRVRPLFSSFPIVDATLPSRFPANHKRRGRRFYKRKMVPGADEF